MNNTILQDGAVVYYAVLVNGQTVSAKYTDAFTAEQYKLSLPEDQQKLAEVLPVDASGRQLLLG